MKIVEYFYVNLLLAPFWLAFSVAHAQSPTSTSTSTSSSVGLVQVDQCASYDGQVLSLKEHQLRRLPNIPLAYAGFNILEGPVWLDGSLFYSNIGSRSDGQQVLSNQGTLWRWQPDKASEVWLDDRLAGTNGLALSGSGLLVAGRQLDGSIVTIDPKTRELKPLAMKFEDKRFNSPNDLTVAQDGSIYFTDPNWNTPSTVDLSQVQGGGQPGEILPGQRVYRLSAGGVVAALSVTEQVKDLRDKPNGILLTTDQQQMYIASTKGLWVFDLAMGWPANPKQLLSTAVDGMGQDCAGNVYIATSRKLLRRADAQIVLVLDQDHSEIGFIEVPGVQVVTNVAFGGAEYKTLFITTLGTASSEQQPLMCGPDPCLPASIFTVELNVPGLPY